MTASLSASDLLERARGAEKVTPSRCNTERWMPTVDLLRRKGWSYCEIYAWLKAQGEPVQKCRSSFISAVSRRYRRNIEAARLEALASKFGRKK